MSELLTEAAFPRARKYDQRWVRANALGENVLCQAEALARHLPFRAGMRVLDLGCGKAVSSIFLAREFEVEVWAADNTVSVDDNYRRAVELGCDRRVFPLRVDARQLPFPRAFFDAVIAIDSFLYFGTDDRYLSYVAEFIKPGGHVGIVDIGLSRELGSAAEAPEHLRAEYAGHWSYVHTVDWWKRHWEKTGVVDVEHAAWLPESEALLDDYLTGRPPEQEPDPIMRALHGDEERLLQLFCLVARKR